MRGAKLSKTFSSHFPISAMQTFLQSLHYKYGTHPTQVHAWGFPHKTCHFINEQECTHQDLEHAIPWFHAFRSFGHRLLPSRRHDWALHWKQHIPSLQQGRGLYK